MKELVPVERLGAVCNLLESLGCQYTVHRNDEDEFSFLKDGEVSVKIPNPYTERTMFIDFRDEISLFFGEEWHCHYSYKEDFRELCETVRGIMNNELCSVGRFSEDGHQCGGCLGAKSDDFIKLGEYYAQPVSRLIEEYKEAWSKNDENIEVHFLYWHTKDDRTVIFGRHNSVLEMKYGLVDEVLDILNEIDDLLEELGCEHDVHRDKDEEFPDYTENNACVIAFNPHADRNMTIEITKSEEWSEMTLYFAEQHAHYAFDELSELLGDVRAIIANELGDGEVYRGEKRRPSMGGYVSRADVETKPPADCFGVSVSESEWEKDGAEIRFKFWDPKFDRTVVIKKRS